MLRASFPEQDGIARQVIGRDADPNLKVYDLSQYERSRRETAAESLIQRLSRRPFDLSRDPLLRAALVRLSGQEHIIVLTMHHIVCDGWSLGIIFTELKYFYDLYLNGGPVDVPELPLQYSDFASWERDRQGSEEVAAQMEYWRHKLKGSPAILDLPIDNPRPLTPSFKSALHPFQLDAATSDALKAFAVQEGATLFMALLAVFKALLSRYARQNDILVGTPVSSRTRPELEQLVGCFINTHVLRTVISAGMTPRGLLAQIRKTVVETLDNSDVPFELLVNELVIKRDLTRSPLFQVAFTLQNSPMASEYQVVNGGAAFDITLYMWESNGTINGSVEYATDLFKPETITHFAACFVTLVREMIAHPDAAIERLPVLTAAQEAEWFADDQGPRLPYPRDLCTHEWIERQAAASPNAIAIVCGRERLTYGQLSARSNRLANQLRALGVGPNSLVGVCVDRSLDLVIAPFAVWKAGGAYVPLDPDYPSKRLEFMLEDSGASVLITQRRLLDRLPQDGYKVICLDRDGPFLESENPQASPTSLAAPENLAYVIYTSGSTGKPKGVEIPHRALVNFLFSMQRQPGIAHSDRLLAVTTLSFDIAGLELYLPLVTGAQVVIAPRTAVMDGAALARLLADSSITIMQATPVTWRLLLESGWRGTPGLKILCGGEALTKDLADRLLACGAEVWNLYGPTETTIWSTLHRLDSGDSQVPIGRPIANTQVYLLDEYGQLVPPGVSGELYIGGDGLARGYLRGSELTAQRFVEHAFHGGERLYRTGDLARRRPDGLLECLGRVDHQVKLRGYRIELGEIEAAIQNQPGIRDALVVLREEVSGDHRLTAYLRMEDGVSADSRALRKELSAILPEYMIPAAFVPLNSFPLTPNRKIDRKALLKMGSAEMDRVEAGHGFVSGQDQLQAAASYTPPSDHLEGVMTEIWQEVLDVSRVGVHDNFFELGGHSLSATRLIAKLRDALGVALPLRSIFLDPTIAELSKHFAYDASSRSYRYASEIPKWSCLVPAQPRGTRTPLFFVGGYTTPDDTLLVLSRLVPHLGMSQPVFGLRPRWVDGVSDGYASVEELAREFAAEIRALQPHGPYLLGGLCVGGIAALEVAQLLYREGEEVRLLALIDTQRPTRSTTLRNHLYFTLQRGRHMRQVFSEIIRSGGRTRSEMIRGLMHRRLGLASSEVRVMDRFYKMKVRYRRLLYSHGLKPYPGRVTLIVSEEQAGIGLDRGWAGAAQGGVEVHRLPGDRYSILTNHGKQVAKVIRDAINEGMNGCQAEEDHVEVNVS